MTCAEALYLIRLSEVGVVFHLLSSVVIIWATQVATDDVAVILQSLLLVPLFRLLNLGVPGFTSDPLVFLTFIYGLLFVSTATLFRSQGLTVDRLGLSPKQALLFVPGMLMGISIGFGQHVILPQYRPFGAPGESLLVAVAGLGLLAGFVEELVFRGFIQRWTELAFGRHLAISSVSVLFGIMHGVWLSPEVVLFAGLLAVLLGSIYVRSNNLWFVVGIHGGVNIGAFLLAPLYVDVLLRLIP